MLPKDNEIIIWLEMKNPSLYTWMRVYFRNLLDKSKNIVSVNIKKIN